MDDLLDKDKVYSFMRKLDYLDDDGLTHIPNGEDDYDIDVDYPGNSYVDRRGIRHAIVWDQSWEQTYRRVNGQWVMDRVF